MAESSYSNGPVVDGKYDANSFDLESRGANAIAEPTPAQNASSIGKSNSFRERAAARPDLFVQTSPVQGDESSRSPANPSDPYNLASPSAYPSTRKSSVPDRSPLQTLESKLGDISKEEKRARAVKAEEDVVRRHSTKQRGKPGDWKPSEQSAKRTTAATRGAPIPASNGVGRSFSGPAHQSDRDLEPNDHSAMSGVQQGSIFLPRSRTRSSGYNANLARDPAHAAVGAYQSSRRRPSGPRSSSSSSSDGHGSLDGQTSSKAQQHTARDTTADFGPSSNAPAVQQQLRTDRTGASSGRKTALKSQQPDPLPTRDVRFKDPEGPPHSIPPQTAGGQQARKRVVFGDEDPNMLAASGHQGQDQHQHPFRDMFHRGDQSQERRYRMAPARTEWKKAEVGTLDAQYLDLSQKAWWESKGQPRSKSRGTQNGNSVIPETLTNGTYSAATTFQPALNLRCGPLLRYTGIRKDRDRSAQFWRGSVMIVTDDASSIYSSSRPTLRMFKQPMTLLPSPANQHGVDDDEEAQRLSNDLTAGLPKVSRTGQTLYVKPIHQVQGEVDLSQVENDQGLFERTPSTTYEHSAFSRLDKDDGERNRQFLEVKGFPLHAERGLTFWRFNIEIELGAEQTRIAYRINKGPATGFWVPAKGASMNIMFHSCNGFSMSVNPNEFSGPDPLWRDVLSSHQIRPFHCMIGGGDQLYNDRAMRETEHFQHWLSVKNPTEKHHADFSEEMQDELEQYYLNRYAMWFSQGLFGLANSQIPMINVWDDHDIIDGYGSYPHHFMSTPVFTGIGAIAFKYYMLFQHQSLPDETAKTEPSWLLGAGPGPYINQLSRNLFMSLGQGVELLGLDCRTERMRDEIMSQETYDIVFDRCRQEIVRGETKHLIVLLGVPVAYPRLNFLENVLTSRAMDPLKALGRTGMLGGFVNKFDGGVEILDDLDDHWTAKHHKHERNWFIQELQELAAEKSVRITVLGGDVHLAAIGQFYSNPKLGLAKDRDHRYMPNVISSAIVNTPPPDVMADVLNKRNKVHHLDAETDEYMIPIFDHDVDGKKRNNNNLLPRRNWCSIRTFDLASSANDYHHHQQLPPTIGTQEPPRQRRSFSLTRSLSRSRNEGGEKQGFLRRFSTRKAPPSAYRDLSDADQPQESYGTTANTSAQQNLDGSSFSRPEAEGDCGRPDLPRSNSWHQRPNTLSRRQSKNDRTGRQGEIDLGGGLEVTINCEIDQRDPAGFTEPYTVIVPALLYESAMDPNTSQMKGRMEGFLGSFRSKKTSQHEPDFTAVPYETTESQGTPPPTATVDQRGLAIDGSNDDPDGRSGVGEPALPGGVGAGALVGVGAYASSRGDQVGDRDSQQFQDAEQYQATTQQNPINAASADLAGSRQSSRDVTSNKSNGGLGESNRGVSYGPTHQNPINLASQDLHGGQSARHMPATDGLSAEAPNTSQKGVGPQNSTDSIERPYPRPPGDLTVPQKTRAALSRSMEPEASNVSDDYYSQPRQRRSNASGPPRPSNFDQLPASVQKRYSQLNDSTTQQSVARSRSDREPPDPNNRHSYAYGTGQAYSQEEGKLPTRVQSERQPSQRRRRWSSLLHDPGSKKRYGQFEPFDGSAGVYAGDSSAGRYPCMQSAHPQASQGQTTPAMLSFDQFPSKYQSFNQPPSANQSFGQDSSARQSLGRSYPLQQSIEPLTQRLPTHPYPIQQASVKPKPTRPIQAAAVAQPTRQPSQPPRSQVAQPSYIEPSAPPTADQYHRRYATGPMEMPLLPVTQNQLRSSHHRRIQSVEGGDEQDISRSVSDPMASRRPRHGQAQTSAAYVNSLPRPLDSTPYTGPQNTNTNSASNPYDLKAATYPLSTEPLSRGQSQSKSSKLQRKRGSRSSRHRPTFSEDSTGAVRDSLMETSPARSPPSAIGVHLAPNGTGASYQSPQVQDATSPLTPLAPLTTEPQTLGEGGGVIPDGSVDPSGDDSTASMGYEDSPEQSPSFARPSGEMHTPPYGNGSGAATGRNMETDSDDGDARNIRYGQYGQDERYDNDPSPPDEDRGGYFGNEGMNAAGYRGSLTPAVPTGPSGSTVPTAYDMAGENMPARKKNIGKHLGFEDEVVEIGDWGREERRGRPTGGKRRSSGGGKFGGMVRRLSGRG